MNIFVTLVGYKRNNVGDTIYRGTKLSPIVIDSDSPWRNNTYLKYKDSDYSGNLPPRYDSILFDPHFSINGFILPLIQSGTVELFSSFFRSGQGWIL